jgi:molybdate transport system ATP-binding protein
MNNAKVLIDFTNATIVRSGSEPTIRGLSWQLREGESWAIIGPTASGKTTLAEAMCGRHRVVDGSLSWPMLGEGVLPGTVIQHIGFQENSRAFSYAGQYYQQRYEFADAEQPLTVREYLQAQSERELHEVAELLRIRGLLDLAFMKLSNGQTRRARIAKGLLAKPELLILDDPFSGVDVQGRAELSELLGEFQKQGHRLLLLTRREMVPAWVTDLLELSGSALPGPTGLPTNANLKRTDRPTESGVPSTPTCAARQATPTGILELRDVTVRHGGKLILDSINWSVQAGERWALLGPNGAGKTTLLALLCGDHPQVFSNDIRLFGQRRGSGETIWDIKRRVGFVSPEFHLYFSEPLNGFEVATTGFHDVLIFREPTPEQAEIATQFFHKFGCESLLQKPFRQLSTGQQRLVLLIRALVKRPPLLVLDEPFQGLDSDTISRVRDWLDANLDDSQTLIFVTHIESDLPRCVNRRLMLNNGRVQGES